MKTRLLPVLAGLAALVTLLSAAAAVGGITQAHADIPGWSVTLSKPYTNTAGNWLTAKSSSDVAQSPYRLQIFNVSTGQRVVVCSEGTTCSMRALPVTKQDSYIAVVGSDSASYPPATKVAQSKIVTPPGWSVTLSPPYTNSSGNWMTATTNFDVGYSTYRLQVFDVTTGQRVDVCSSGLACNVRALPVTKQDSYVAVIGPDRATYTAADVVVKSATVTPPGWAVQLSRTTVGTSGAGVLTATSTFDVGFSSYRLQIFNKTTGVRVTSCYTGVTCSAPLPAGNYQFIAGVGQDTSTYQPGKLVALSAVV